MLIAPNDLGLFLNNLIGGWMMLDVVERQWYWEPSRLVICVIVKVFRLKLQDPRLGYRSGWISRVRNDEFGKKVISTIRSECVDVGEVVYDEEAQTCLFFKEKLTENEVRVYYYRQDSAASHFNPSDLNEAYIAQAKYVHITDKRFTNGFGQTLMSIRYNQPNFPTGRFYINPAILKDIQEQRKVA